MTLQFGQLVTVSKPPIGNNVSQLEVSCGSSCMSEVPPPDSSKFIAEFSRMEVYIKLDLFTVEELLGCEL